MLFRKLNYDDLISAKSKCRIGSVNNVQITDQNLTYIQKLLDELTVYYYNDLRVLWSETRILESGYSSYFKESVSFGVMFLIFYSRSRNRNSLKIIFFTSRSRESTANYFFRRFGVESILLSAGTGTESVPAPRFWKSSRTQTKIWEHFSSVLCPYLIQSNSSRTPSVLRTLNS